MSNGDNKSVLEQCLAVLVKIGMMVVDGVREPAQVLRWMQVIISRKDFVSILDTPPQASVDTSSVDWRLEWEKFYQEVFGLTPDFSKLDVRDDPGGFGWVVFIAAGLTLNSVWAKCRDRFPHNSVYGDDLDTAVPNNDRDAKISYAMRFRNRVEADEENKSKSANDLAKQKSLEITLRERLLLTLWYNWRTGGGHLDLLNVTLCAGSRSRDGGVPSVRWDDRQLRVYSYGPGGAGGDLRSRSAA